MAKSLPSQLNFGAESVDLQAAAETEVPSFSMVAYSGGVLRVSGFPHPVVVDLSGVEVNANAVALLDHNSVQRVGHFDDITVHADKITAEGKVSAVNPHAEEVTQSARRGYKWHASIGARVIEAQMVPEGRRVVVNGRTFVGPVIVARKARLNEVSFVGFGGDEDNQVSLAATFSEVYEEPDMKFSEWLTAQGWVETELTESQLTTLRAAYDASNPGGEPSVPATPAPVVQASGSGNAEAQAAVGDLRAALAADRERIAATDRILEGRPDLQAQAIREGWDATRAELEMWRSGRDVLQAGQAPFGRSTGRAARNTPAALEVAIGRQLGVQSELLEASHSDQTLSAADSRELRNITLRQLMDMTVEAAGFNPGIGSYADPERWGLFVTAERRNREANLLAHGNSFSAISTTGILSNTANKLLLQAYNGVGGVAMSLSARRTVSDFKLHTAYRLTLDGTYAQIGKNGEIKHASLKETSYTNSAKTYGVMLSLGREDIINDDLGAFQSIPTAMGRQAAIFFEKTWFTKLLANAGPIFHADNGNLLTGGSSPLSISSLSSALALFRKMKDANGDLIMVSPAILLVPSALEVLADQLYAEMKVNETTTANVPKVASNPHAGKYRPIASAHLDGAGLANESATGWYLLANPADLALMTVSLLNGRDTPVVESSDVDFNVLGIQFRAVHDFGIDTNDVKAGVKSNGA